MVLEISVVLTLKPELELDCIEVAGHLVCTVGMELVLEPVLVLDCTVDVVLVQVNVVVEAE